MTSEDIIDFFSTRHTHPWGTQIETRTRSSYSILEEEKKQGLDVEVRYVPVFFNTWEGIKAALWFLLWIGLEGRAAYMYVRNPEESVGAGILFMIGMAGMVLYVTRISSWYPLMRTEVDERKVRQYVGIQLWLRSFCLVLNLFLSLTPLWCFLLAERLSDYGEAHGWSPWVSEYDYDSNGWTMGMVAFLSLTSLMLMIWILTDSFGSEKSIRQRLRYLYYRSGEMEKAEVKLRNDMFRKMELIEIKKREIATLEEEIDLMRAKF